MLLAIIYMLCIFLIIYLSRCQGGGRGASGARTHGTRWDCICKLDYVSGSKLDYVSLTNYFSILKANSSLVFNSLLKNYIDLVLASLWDRDLFSGLISCSLPGAKYRVVFLTGPPDFQYQNEKQVAANQD